MLLFPGKMLRQTRYKLAAELSTDQIIAKMVGRELTNVYPPKENKPGEVIMEVKDLCSIHEKSFQHVSFELRKGEILGFGGLVGAQRTELMEGIFGIRGIASGEIYMHGKKTRYPPGTNHFNTMPHR